MHTLQLIRWVLKPRRVFVFVQVCVVFGFGGVFSWLFGQESLQPLKLDQVKFTDGFWLPRAATNCRVTVWHCIDQCEKTGRIANFAVAAGIEKGGFRGIFFNDSDVFKVIEGASWCLALQRDEKLEAYLEHLIKLIAAAQEPDGYLYTARTIGDPNYDFPGREARWSQLGASHELYNVGHLYEAAVAYWQVTGRKELLQVAVKNADLICQVFGPGPEQRKDVPGHQEIEIGLVKLYQATGEEKYLKQADFFLQMRGRSDVRSRLYGAYCQDHVPVTEQREAVGHAVRAGYLYAAMADMALLADRQDYRDALRSIWQDVVYKKMYLTGGVGSQAQGEAFGRPYELPNESAYSETCAAIAQMLWQHRMFLLDEDSRYIDVLERILYNGFLAGVSLTGDRFFYPNPLACRDEVPFNHGTFGRSAWFSCACCPVNVVRIIPQIPCWIYAQRKDSLYVNLYIPSCARVEMDGTAVELQQTTDYPWQGRVVLEFKPARPVRFTLRLRIPGWVSGGPLPGDLYRFTQPSSRPWEVSINGERLAEPQITSGYLIIERQWQPGDRVTLDLPMETRRVVAHPSVEADRGRVALVRGPLVYCVEAVDNQGSVYDLELPDEATLSERWEKQLLGGIVVVEAHGRRLSRSPAGGVEAEPALIRAIPYYAWAHRDMGQMLVWLARGPEAASPRPLPTLARLSRPSASHCWPYDTVKALNDQLEPSSSIDHSIPRHTCWDHRGTTEWVQYDFPGVRRVSAVEVYWFDDTGRGHCRVPRSWRVVYRKDGQWLPVEAVGPYETATNRFNRVAFQPVETDALRLLVELQPQFSAGILEWKVEEASPDGR